MKKVFVLFLFIFSLLIKAQTPTGGDLVGLHHVSTVDLVSITGPIVGSILYNPTDENIYVYKVIGGWTAIGSSNEWRLDGNKITNTNFLGSINAEDLVFKANNIERVRIKQNTGNIGIGTSSPNYKLEVNGTAKIEDTPTITNATKVLVKDPTNGQISEQEIPIGLLNGKFLMSFSGRAYYYSNRWYSTHDNYGTGYPHWNSYKGAAATPAYSTVNQHGIPITSEATLLKFTIKNDFNAVPVAPRINLAVIRNGTTIDIGTYAINNPSTNVTIQTEKVGFLVKEGDLLVWAANSSGGNRLSYTALTFEFIY